MPTGTIVGWNDRGTTGFGFVENDNGGADVFFRLNQYNPVDEKDKPEISQRVRFWGMGRNEKGPNTQKLEIYTGPVEWKVYWQYRHDDKFYVVEGVFADEAEAFDYYNWVVKVLRHYPAIIISDKEEKGFHLGIQLEQDQQRGSNIQPDIDRLKCTAGLATAHKGPVMKAEILKKNDDQVVDIVGNQIWKVLYAGRSEKQENAVGLDEIHDPIELFRTYMPQLALMGYDFKSLHPATGCNLLHYASRFGWVQCMNYLIEEHGMDLNTPSRDQTTPLHQAAFYQQSEACKILIELGADIDCINAYNETALEAWRAQIDRVKRSPLGLDGKSAAGPVKDVFITAATDYVVQLTDKTLHAAPANGFKRQRWSLVHVRGCDDWFFIVCVGTKWNMAVKSGKNNTGYVCLERPSQRWTQHWQLRDEGDYYAIVNRHDPKKVLELGHDGMNLVDPSDTNAQKFRLLPVVRMVGNRTVAKQRDVRIIDFIDEQCGYVLGVKQLPKGTRVVTKDGLRWGAVHSVTEGGVVVKDDKGVAFDVRFDDIVIPKPERAKKKIDKIRKSPAIRAQHSPNIRPNGSPNIRARGSPNLRPQRSPNMRPQRSPDLRSQNANWRSSPNLGPRGSPQLRPNGSPGMGPNLWSRGSPNRYNTPPRQHVPTQKATPDTLKAPVEDEAKGLQKTPPKLEVVPKIDLGAASFKLDASTPPTPKAFEWELLQSKTFSTASSEPLNIKQTLNSSIAAPDTSAVSPAATGDVELQKGVDAIAEAFKDVIQTKASELKPEAPEFVPQKQKKDSPKAKPKRDKRVSDRAKVPSVPKWMKFNGETAKRGELAEAYTEERGWVPVEVVSRIPYTSNVLRVRFQELWEGFITEWPVGSLRHSRRAARSMQPKGGFSGSGGRSMLNGNAASFRPQKQQLHGNAPSFRPQAQQHRHAAGGFGFVPNQLPDYR